MHRRSFLFLTPGIFLFGNGGFAAPARTGRTTAAPVRELAGMQLTELRDWYRGWLFDDFLPFFDKFIIDHEYGGFMCNADRDGTLVSTTKSAGYLGRGAWVYAHLYRAIDKNPKHLEVARQSLEFLLKTRSVNGRWTPSFTREGTPQGEISESVNSDLYIAEGINEYARATGEKKYRDLAREILFNSLKLYDTPGYLAGSGKGYLGPDAVPIKGVAPLDDWMLFLRLATQMLEEAPDPEIEAVAKRCRDSITGNFYNPEFGLLTEYVQQDLSRFGNDLDQVVTFGNIFQALWHTLDEAARIRDRTLFDTTAGRIRRHIEVAWDDVYGGLFGTLRNVDKNEWITYKINYVQAETLTGLLGIIEHTGADWAREWYGRIYMYMAEKFPLKQYGFPLWMVSGDRKATFVRKTNRAENYHHPRHLILTVERLERIIKRGGKVSGVV
jgi:mannose/cellobiose epimerase-like protein (N-acyl-D-glucosamine 2-epimerase family)